MQKLNCKVGDLAIVVDAVLPENLGQIVEVIGEHAGEPIGLLGPWYVWQVRVASGRPRLHYRYPNGVVDSYAEGPVPDCRLRPLPGIAEADELPTSVDLPARQRDQQAIEAAEPALQS